MKKVVVTSFDKNYMDYSRVAVKSLGMNYHGDDVLDVVCLVPEDILGHAKEYADSIKQPNLNIQFKTTEGFKRLSEAGSDYVTRHSSPGAWQRIFIGSTLPDHDVAIYIDPDTIILRDIKPLLEYRSRSPFCAVVETVNMPKIIFDSHDMAYFNNGVFIADLNFWRDERIEDKILGWVADNGETELAEQDAMNMVLGEWLSPLPFSFNFFEWTIFANKVMAEEFDNPLIVHFAGKEKPWGPVVISKYAGMWKNLYRRIADA